MLSIHLDVGERDDTAMDMRPFYRNFAELSTHHSQGEDFTIESTEGGSGISILAIHGGRIEPGTDLVAGKIAGTEHNLYVFKGLRPRNNKILHLPSTLFDEPLCLNMVRRSSLVVSIHGCRGASPAVIVGGANRLLSRQLCQLLAQDQLPVISKPPSGLRGTSKDNICNYGTGGGGLQIELSRGFRELLGVFGNTNGKSDTSTLLGTFSRHVRRVLASCQSSMEPISKNS